MGIKDALRFDTMDLLATLSLAEGTPFLSNAPVIAGRYRIVETLGAGGFGTVFRAFDEVREEEVALKVLEGAPDARFRRETSALRLLQLPGVVRLHDEFVDGDRTCLVMELVEGAPFPGRAVGGWDELRDVTLALLDTLARVHAYGVIHRDIKPANILVRASGQPILLDFGLSTGPALGRTITQTGQILGTPAYFAPEQLFGRRADVRADLYAVGVMLYEALSGALPHAEAGPAGVLSRATRPPAGLRERVPQVPEDVARVIDSLLAVSPSDRPGSAGEVLGLLSGRGSTASRIEASFPWLGSREAVEAVVARARAGQKTRIGGAKGSGRTRLALEAAAQLESLGHPVHRLPSGGTPLSSLRPVFTPGDGKASWSDMQAEARRAVEDFLADGGVFILDLERPPDAWTGALVDELGERGAVIQIVDGDGDVEPLRLSAPDLEVLFAGHELLFHLPSDAAAELMRRSDGVPGRIEAEVTSWLRSGLARRDGAALTISREALVRLASGGDGAAPAFTPLEMESSPQVVDLLAWIELAAPHADEPLLLRVTGHAAWELEAQLQLLVDQRLVRRRKEGGFETVGTAFSGSWSAERRAEAHSAIADAIPIPSAATLFHLAAAGRVADLAGAAVDYAARKTWEGRLAEAEAVLSEALAAVRSSDTVDAVHQLVVERVETALAGASPGAYRRGRLDLDRTGLPDLPVVERGRRLLEAATLGLGEDSERALDVLEHLEPFDDLRLERRRRAIRARATSRDPSRRESELQTLEAWAREVGDEETLASVAGWRGMALFRESRFDEAAERHLAAARSSRRRMFVLSARLNAASALQEAGRYDEARSLALAAIPEARELRHPTYEARAIWISRAATYRAGQPLEYAPEFISALEELGNQTLLGLALITEAGIAFRAGEMDALVALAGKSSVALRRARLVGPSLWMEALTWVGGRHPDPERLVQAQELAENAVLDLLAVQISSFLAISKLDPGDAARERAARVLEDLDEADLEENQGILTWREMAEALGIERRGA